MDARRTREALALRLNRWVAQEVKVGRMTQARSYGGELTSAVYILNGERLSSPDLADDSGLMLEHALDLPCTSELRAGKEVGARAWMIVAERIGTSGELPTLPEVLSTRSAYWSACDAAHDARRARDKGAVPKVHTRAPETPRVAPERAVEPVACEARGVFEQAAIDAYWEEMDRPRGQAEPLWFMAREMKAAKQDFEVWRWRKDQARMARVAARLDEVPQWGEEMRR